MAEPTITNTRLFSTVRESPNDSKIPRAELKLICKMLNVVLTS